jgi:N4-gp56 family major capsid protein
MALRTEPVVGQFVDVHPVQPTAPGSAIVLQKYNDLSAATTPLSDEFSSASNVVIPATSTVTITLASYGNVVVTTEFLHLTSLSDIEPAKADLVARNVIDSREELIMATARAGTNVIYAGASGAVDTTGPTNAVASGDTMSAKQVRRAVTELRARNAPAWRDEFYAALVHPRQAVDLREDAGAGNWLAPHQYNANTAIWKGEVGSFEGAAFIETNRVYSATDGTTSQRVYRALFLGKEALAEAVALPFQVVVGPETDNLRRGRTLGWKSIVGYGRFREECMQRLETAATS